MANAVESHFFKEPLGLVSTDESQTESLLKSDFMKVPEDYRLRSIVEEFATRTGNDALKTAICGCCASEMEIGKLVDIPLDLIPNSTKLTPRNAHPCHNLFYGMLLEPNGVNMGSGRANLCRDCYGGLEQDKIPPFALANELWIGRVPECLRALTLVEVLLIAKYLPTAYVVKLFPKQSWGGNWDPSQLYTGFKGCVSTYPLDPQMVVAMVDGQILPSKPEVLAAVVGVTFVAPSGRRQFPFPNMLHARRRNVREALEWLKSNNPLYRNVTISEANLLLIPENGVPIEIQMVTKHSTDVDGVLREHEGYVPEEPYDQDEEGGLGVNRGRKTENCTGKFSLERF